MKALSASSHRFGADTRRAAPNPRAHALFKNYPIDGHARLSTGLVLTPYHVYHGHGLFVGGTADLDAVRQLLEPEQVQAVSTQTGRALMGVWVFDFSDASLGPHHELQVSIFVSRAGREPVSAHRLALIELMLTRPDVQMLCHGLWNNAAQVVAYHRALLALDARLCDSRIERNRRMLRFRVDDEATRGAVLEGRIDRPQRPSLLASLALATRLGVRRLAALTRQPWIRMPVLNPVGAVLGRNAAADSFTKSESSVLRYFDPARDRLVFGDERYRCLRFEPQFVQTMDGFKFVYLFPS